MSIKISKGDKTALLFGATGLIGKHCLSYLLASDNYAKVIIFVRKKTDIAHPKLTEHVINFDDLATYKELFVGDDLFYAIGTTIKKAGNKRAFVKVDYTYGVIIANFAVRNKVNQLIFISSIGADKNSLFFYMKVKGQLEHDLCKLNFWATHVIRPSVLLGKRNEQRLAESISGQMGALLGKVIGNKMGKFRPIEAKKVARAMVEIAQGLEKGIHIYNSNRLEDIGNSDVRSLR